MAKLIKVLIVDDSAVIRALLTEIFTQDGRFQVVAAAEDPLQARDLIKETNPDVLTLDIEMPKMNGIAFLKNLMRLRPMPVVMISTLTQAGAPSTLEALEIGAVDFIGKPNHDDPEGLAVYRTKICNKVSLAAGANVLVREQRVVSNSVLASPAASGKRLKPNFICAIGASTGGTEAIKDVLVQLPKACPPIVIAQHIPASFSASFANRLDKVTELKVYEAEDKQVIQPGCVYLAPGDRHLRIEKTARGYMCVLDDSEPVNRHKPSVEVLYHSVRDVAGSNSMGVILTGMGADGANALASMRENGSVTVAQDEASSVVWGMPGAAVKAGGAGKVLPLDKIAKYILYQAYNA